MPFSDAEGKDTITDWYRRLKPDSVLDVGVGVGTYAKLLRAERAGVWWAGVEVWRPYVVEYLLADHYDELVLADVRTLDWKRWARWDLVILGDVLEHMGVNDARNLWFAAMRHSAWVIASIPLVHAPQGAVFGNPYETHHETYDHERVWWEFPGITQWKAGQTIGVYLAPGKMSYDPALKA